MSSARATPPRSPAPSASASAVLARSIAFAGIPESVRDGAPVGEDGGPERRIVGGGGEGSGCVAPCTLPVATPRVDERERVLDDGLTLRSGKGGCGFKMSDCRGVVPEEGQDGAEHLVETGGRRMPKREGRFEVLASFPVREDRSRVLACPAMSLGRFRGASRQGLVECDQ